MSLRHIWAITRKELIYIRRDRASLFLVVLTPVILLILMAYALVADIEHVPLVVLDQDRSASSRAFIQQLTLGDDLDLELQVDSMADVENSLLDGRAHAAIVIPPGFEADLVAMRGLPLQVLVNGTEPQTGGFAVTRLTERAEQFIAPYLADYLSGLGGGEQVLEPIDLRVRTWYNPNLKANVDMIPGLISLVLGIPGLSVAMTLAREHEHGTMEQLMATPISRAELLVGKIGPYLLSGVVNVILTTGFAMWWFDVPFRGSFLLYLLLSVFYFFSLLSMGMIVGVFLRTQAGALAASFLVVFFPGFFLTGIFFPIAAMPSIVRLEASALPGTHFTIITRGIFTTGVGLSVLWPNLVAMIVLGVVFIGIAALFFRKKLA
jgi:ABC-2 type transport system permease protein